MPETVPTNPQSPTQKGTCLCKKITFEFTHPRQVVNCHCEACRKFHGNFAAYSKTQQSNLRIEGAEHLKWYQIKEGEAKRGWCNHCGSSLFWQAYQSEELCISAGSLETPTHLTTDTNIYVDFASDYYQLDKQMSCYATTMKNTSPIE